MTNPQPLTSDPSNTLAPASHGATPMMAQYMELKAQAEGCLLFYKMGDFFELFFEDAKIAAATLDIALTSRGEHGGAPIPMCGVPVHSAEAYLARLIRAGHRVAIAEQTETPAQAKERHRAENKPASKALVARNIVRYVTPGTLTEESLLDARSNNMLVALAQANGEYALAAADISTGRFEVMTCTQAGLSAELARLNASEIIAPQGNEQNMANVHYFDASAFASTEGARWLKALYGPGAADDLSRAQLAAIGGLIGYLNHAGKGVLPYLGALLRSQNAAYMAIDAATRESLEITHTLAGSRSGSLLHAIDRTVTGAGARLLNADLSSPLRNEDEIIARLDLVSWLHEAPGQREAVRSCLRALPDIGRALGRIAIGRGSPRDLGQLRDGLNEARMLRERLGRAEARPALLDALLPSLDGHGALCDLLVRALVPSPPTEAANGGYIAEGYDAALDALRATGGDGRRAIAALEARYREESGVASLKIRHNSVLGYHVEVPAKHGDALMREGSGFTHRQTLAGVVRFNSLDLHEHASRVMQAGAHALAAEASHLEELMAAVLARKEAIAAAAASLARLDVAAALAERAAQGGWTRPEFAQEQCLSILGGRHPVVEDALAKDSQLFVSNDCQLNAQDRLWLVTGPNMGGKSTFLRQNALIILLAQAGSFVPATSARLSVVDRLFSRVGASDNLAKGRSTFMVEMVETAAILTQATQDSFVILDEVGRGTSTYDGLALAWAVVEAVHEVNRCRCLFATHYHELTRLAESLPALSLHHVRAREWKGDLVLLHEMAQGPADRSYGIAVARLAGLPPAVLARAKQVLSKLEMGKAQTGGIAAGLDDLPLFAVTQDAQAPASDPLRDAIAALDIDALTPRDALEKLYALKSLAEQAQET